MRSFPNWLVIGVACWVSSQGEAATVEFSFERSTVSAAAAAAGAPQGCEILDLFATTDADILSVNQVLVDVDGGELFNVLPPFGSNTFPPDPAFIALNRALEADSWITTPGSTALLGPDLDATDGTSSFGDLTNDGPQSEFHFARLTVPVGASGTFSGRLSVAGAAGPESFPISMSLGPDSDMLIPIPSAGPLDVGNVCLWDGGLLADVITFTGTGSIAGVNLSNQSIPNLFGASIDGLSVDLFVNQAILQTIPAGISITADLTVETSGGDRIHYNLQTIPCPEPTGLALVGLSMLGFVARFRGTRR